VLSCILHIVVPSFDQLGRATVTLTSIDIPADLLAEVQRLTGQKTKRGAVLVSLEETARRHRQRRAVDAMASLDFLTDMGLPDVREKARG